MKPGDLVEVLGPKELNPRGVGVITSEPMTRLGQHYTIYHYYDVMIGNEIVTVKEDFLRIVKPVENANS